MSSKADFKILNRDSSFDIKNVLVLNNLALPKQSIDWKLIKYCQFITGIRVTFCNKAPDILIDQDNCKLITAREFKEIIENLLLFLIFL